MQLKSKWGKQLQSLNKKAGALHFTQAIVMLLVLNEATKIPVVTRFFDQTAEGIMPVSEVLFEFPVAYIAPIFLLLSAGFHFFISSSFYVKKYEKNIKKGINPLRWWEYSLSSSLMLVVLLMLGGIIEIAAVVFVFTLNFIMNMMGLMMEKHNQLTKKTDWFSFNVGVLAGIVPWILGGLYFWVSTGNIADAIPGYARLGFLLTFIFFNTFAINMWLQYKKIGKWSDYKYGERSYIILSLTAKTALGWTIVLGTMGGAA